MNERVDDLKDVLLLKKIDRLERVGGFHAVNLNRGQKLANVLHLLEVHRAAANLDVMIWRGTGQVRKQHEHLLAVVS